MDSSHQMILLLPRHGSTAEERANGFNRVAMSHSGLGGQLCEQAQTAVKQSAQLAALSPITPETILRGRLERECLDVQLRIDDIELRSEGYNRDPRNSKIDLGRHNLSCAGGCGTLLRQSAAFHAVRQDEARFLPSTWKDVAT